MSSLRRITTRIPPTPSNIGKHWVYISPTTSSALKCAEPKPKFLDLVPEVTEGPSELHSNWISQVTCDPLHLTTNRYPKSASTVPAPVKAPKTGRLGLRRRPDAISIPTLHLEQALREDYELPPLPRSVTEAKLEVMLSREPEPEPPSPSRAERKRKRKERERKRKEMLNRNIYPIFQEYLLDDEGRYSTQSGRSVIVKREGYKLPHQDPQWYPSVLGRQSPAYVPSPRPLCSSSLAPSAYSQPLDTAEAEAVLPDNSSFYSTFPSSLRTKSALTSPPSLRSPGSPISGYFELPSNVESLQNDGESLIRDMELELDCYRKGKARAKQLAGRRGKWRGNNGTRIQRPTLREDLSWKMGQQRDKWRYRGRMLSSLFSVDIRGDLVPSQNQGRESRTVPSSPQDDSSPLSSPPHGDLVASQDEEMEIRIVPASPPQRFSRDYTIAVRDQLVITMEPFLCAPDTPLCSKGVQAATPLLLNEAVPPPPLDIYKPSPVDLLTPPPRFPHKRAGTPAQRSPPLQLAQSPSARCRPANSTRAPSSHESPRTPIHPRSQVQGDTTTLSDMWSVKQAGLDKALNDWTWTTSQDASREQGRVIDFPASTLERCTGCGKASPSSYKASKVSSPTNSTTSAPATSSHHSLTASQLIVLKERPLPPIPRSEPTTPSIAPESRRSRREAKASTIPPVSLSGETPVSSKSHRPHKSSSRSRSSHRPSRHSSRPTAKSATSSFKSTNSTLVDSSPAKATELTHIWSAYLTPKGFTTIDIPQVTPLPLTPLSISFSAMTHD